MDSKKVDNAEEKKESEKLEFAKVIKCYNLPKLKIEKTTIVKSCIQSGMLLVTKNLIK